LVVVDASLGGVLAVAFMSAKSALSRYFLFYSIYGDASRRGGGRGLAFGMGRELGERRF